MGAPMTPVPMNPMFSAIVVPFESVVGMASHRSDAARDLRTLTLPK